MAWIDLLISILYETARDVLGEGNVKDMRGAGQGKKMWKLFWITRVFDSLLLKEKMSTEPCKPTFVLVVQYSF